MQTVFLDKCGDSVRVISEGSFRTAHPVVAIGFSGTIDGLEVRKIREPGRTPDPVRTIVCTIEGRDVVVREDERVVMRGPSLEIPIFGFVCSYTTIDPCVQGCGHISAATAALSGDSITT